MRSFFEYMRRAFDLARKTVLPLHEVRDRHELFVVYALRLGWLVWGRLWRDSCHQKAAALAFQTVLSLVPLLAVVAAIASALKLGEYVGALTEYLETVMLPSAAAAAGTEMFKLVYAVNPSTMGIIGGVGLLVLAVNLLVNLERAVNEVYRCKSARTFAVRIGIALAVLIVAPPTLGLSLYLTGKLMVLPGASLLRALLPLLLTVGALFVCYGLLPGRHVVPRIALASAAVAGVMLELFKLGFAFYARHLGQTLSYLYGTLAILPLFMVWIYLCWVIFLFGAELGAALHEVKTSVAPPVVKAAR
ncbi:MAG: YihY family inner membrane protein [Myxococcota bacterium]|jgi:membrane protein|nr:YihY family inner membrane protein [Myxococcota bacterium]